MKTILISLLAVGVQGHGSMIMPDSRNSVDASPGMPWANGKHPETGLIEPYTCACGNGTDLCSSGQACFWFSQGVSIGCKAATGNGTRLPNLDHCSDERQPGFNPLEIDGALDPKYRTTNLESVPGSISDIWNGMAGGNTYEVFNAGAYNATKFAKQGDLGTKVLKPRPTGTQWVRGAVHRTRLEVTATHGGGYTYQLCPASSPLTEECFRSTQLQFAEPFQHKVIFPDPKKNYFVNATIVAEGGGKGWAIHPFPYSSHAPCDWNPGAFGQHCKWRCKRCGAPWYAADGACPDNNCKHAADLPQNITYGKAIPDLVMLHERGAPLFERFVHGSNTIEDRVVVPADIPAGDYVLRWRWDCEAT